MHLYYFPHIISHPASKHLTMYCDEKIVICSKPSEASETENAYKHTISFVNLLYHVEIYIIKIV